MTMMMMMMMMMTMTMTMTTITMIMILIVVVVVMIITLKLWIGTPGFYWYKLSKPPGLYTDPAFMRDLVCIKAFRSCEIWVATRSILLEITASEKYLMPVTYK